MGMLRVKRQEGAVAAAGGGALPARTASPLSVPADAEVDAESLSSLWRRRGRLSASDTLRLYYLVKDALARYRPPELHALGEDREELIAQFIHLKVLRLDDDAAERGGTSEHSAPSNAYAICAYFRRYLIDCLRGAAHQRNVSTTAEGVAQYVESRAAAPVDELHATLAEHGLSEAEVLVRARRFHASLERPDQLLLSGVLGELSEAPGGLSRVAARHRIASYHYRAGKLGLVFAKGALPSTFAGTRIGRWISQDLGIAIEPENRQAILYVFGLLAGVARRG